MGRATGIGGIFFRSADTQALGAWYERWFGITAGGAPWNTEAGMTVFAPFKADTDYFPADKAFMLNLRVDDLASLIAAFRRFRAGLRSRRQPGRDVATPGGIGSEREPGYPRTGQPIARLSGIRRASSGGTSPHMEGQMPRTGSARNVRGLRQTRGGEKRPPGACRALPGSL